MSDAPTLLNAARRAADDLQLTLNYKVCDRPNFGLPTADRLQTTIDRLRDAIAAAEGGEVDIDWKPTHRHRKGGLYRELARGKLEWCLVECVIYQGQGRDGQIWVRPAIEFDDGRFTPLPPPPQEQEPGDG